MTQAQTLIALGMPALVALVGILVNVGYFVSLNGRMTRIEDKLDLLTGKVATLDTDVAVIRERLGIR